MQTEMEEMLPPKLTKNQNKALESFRIIVKNVDCILIFYRTQFVHLQYFSYFCTWFLYLLQRDAEKRFILVHLLTHIVFLMFFCCFSIVLLLYRRKNFGVGIVHFGGLYGAEVDLGGGF